MILQPNEYEYPSWLPSSSQPDIKPPVVINPAEIMEMASSGATWEQLESFYVVDVTTLQKHFLCIYKQERAGLEMSVLLAMTKKAKAGDATLLKWLSANWLGFTEKTENKETVVVPDEEEVNNRLRHLMEKYK